jgi:RNA ligase (TIGR02306 family)
MRKLASVQTIKNIEPIEGADRIVKATVNAWNVVVKKDEFQNMDKCVFFEIDSILPCVADWAQFMAPRHFRVKTCKLRGVLSQGLALPISILSEGEYDVGDNVTEILNVEKWEPALPGSVRGETIGKKPGHTPKTDEQRVQSEPDLIDELKGLPFYITEKVDGTSGTFIKEDGKLRVCGRNFEYRDSEKSAHWMVVKRYNLEEKLPEGISLQGEVHGPGIQKNRLNLKRVDLRVFTGYDFRSGRRLNWDELVDICKNIGVPTVKVLKVGDSFNMSIEELLEFAKGKYEGTKNNREGIVVRPQKSVKSNILGRSLSFKVINNNFLLKNES